MPILAQHVIDYLEALKAERSEVMLEMEEIATRDNVPIVHWQTGRLLAILVRALATERVLEVGTAIGYSALHMAEAMGTGRILTLERDPRRAAQARALLDRSGVGSRVEIVEGDALATLPTLEGPFGLAFLDATKTEVEPYLELIEPLLSPPGLVVIDNLLMFGEVALPADAETFWDEDALEAARAVNVELQRSERWLGVVLPVGDGVGLAVRRGQRGG